MPLLRKQDGTPQEKLIIEKIWFVIPECLENENHFLLHPTVAEYILNLEGWHKMDAIEIALKKDRLIFLEEELIRANRIIDTLRNHKDLL